MHTWLDAQLDQKFLDGLYIKVYHTYMKYYYMVGDYHKCIEKGGLAVKSLHKEMAEQLAEEWGCEGNQIVLSGQKCFIHVACLVFME